MRLGMVGLLIVAMTSLASDCTAQVPFAVLSWTADCSSPLRNQIFAGPGSYVLCVWVKNLTSANENVGFQLFLTCNATFGDVPDAWRFDDAGCQQGRYTSDQEGGCPAMTGTNPVSSAHLQYEATGQRMVFGYTVSYDAMTPLPKTTYLLWHLSFDQTKSVLETDTDPSTCDHAGDPVCFMIVDPADPNFPSFLLSASNVRTPLAFGDPPDQYAGWNGICPPIIDATQSGTWGRLKGLYR